MQRALTGFAAGVMTAALIWSLLIPSLEGAKGMGKLSFIPAVTGFAVGVGYEFDFGMFLNVRYAMDFSNSYNKIISDETTGKAVSWENYPSKQWGVALSVGYKFKIK